MANPRMRCIKPDTDQLRAKCRPYCNNRRRYCEEHKLYQNGIDRPGYTGGNHPVPLVKGRLAGRTDIGNTGITKNRTNRSCVRIIQGSNNHTQRNGAEMRILIGIAIGVCATYIYFNPGSQDEVLDTVKNGINQGATIVQDLTK